MKNWDYDQIKSKFYLEISAIYSVLINAKYYIQYMCGGIIMVLPMEKSVTEARGEIEAFMQNQIQNIAMKAITTNVDENGLSDFNKMIAIE